MTLILRLENMEKTASGSLKNVGKPPLNVGNWGETGGKRLKIEGLNMFWRKKKKRPFFGIQMRFVATFASVEGLEYGGIETLAEDAFGIVEITCCNSLPLTTPRKNKFIPKINFGHAQRGRYLTTENTVVLNVGVGELSEPPETTPLPEPTISEPEIEMVEPVEVPTKVSPSKIEKESEAPIKPPKRPSRPEKKRKRWDLKEIQFGAKDFWEQLRS